MNMIYAALLLHSAKKEISEANLKKVTEATGEKVEEAQVKAMVAALDGVNIDEAITKAAMPVAVAAAPAVASEAKAEKKEEKAEDTEKKAEEAAAGLSSLFG